jgi:hypothetical protein
VANVEECAFYHHMDLPGLKEVEGWDLRKTIDEYLGHLDFRGKRVLDVGAAGGFLTFEMKKRGAEVPRRESDKLLVGFIFFSFGFLVLLVNSFRWTSFACFL